MEECRTAVIDLHATLFQIISKFTSDISKHTSEFTSKTDQLRKNARSMRGSATSVVSYLDGDLVRIIAWKNITNKVINLHANPIPEYW